MTMISSAGGTLQYPLRRSSALYHFHPSQWLAIRRVEQLPSAGNQYVSRVASQEEVV